MNIDELTRERDEAAEGAGGKEDDAISGGKALGHGSGGQSRDAQRNGGRQREAKREDQDERSWA